MVTIVYIESSRLQWVSTRVTGSLVARDLALSRPRIWDRVGKVGDSTLLDSSRYYSSRKKLTRLFGSLVARDSVKYTKDME